MQVALGLLQRGLHEEAAGQLERFLTEQPRDPRVAEANYRLGTARSELGQKELAVTAFERALGPAVAREAGEERPAFLAECRYRLGHLLRELGHAPRALTQFELLLREQPDDHYLAAASAWAAGELYAAAGDTGRALAAYDRAAASDRDQAATYAAPASYAAGFLLLETKPAEAALRFGRVAEQHSRHALAAECRYLQGEALLRAGDTGGATDVFQSMLRGRGEWRDDALLGLARARLAAGDEDQALAAFRRLAAEHADSPHVARARIESARILHARGRHDEAAREVGSVGGDVGDAGLRDAAIELRAIALLDASKPADAIALLEPALAVVNDDGVRGRMQNLLGDACAAQEQWEQARAAYAAATDHRDPAIALEARYGVALAEHRLGRHEDSLRSCRQILRRDPDARMRAHAQFALAENLFALARYDEALAAYGELGTEHAFGDRPRFKQGWCHYLAKQYGEAAQIFGELAGKDGDLAAEALSLQALAALEAGELDAALAAADRYAARHADGPYRDRCERVAARVLRERGDLVAAEQRLARAARASGGADGGAGDRLQVAELRFRRGDFEAARRSYAELSSREDATGAAAATGVAWCLFELGEDEACLRAIEQALAHPQAAGERPALHELAAALHSREARHAEAAQWTRAFLQEFPSHERAPAMRLNLAVALSRGGDAAGAIAVLEPLTADPRGLRADRVWYELAWARKRSGDADGAAAAFAKVAATSEDPELTGEARLQVGEHLLAANQTERARKELAAVQGSHRGRALYRLGFSFVEAGDHAAAAEAFAGILQSGDTSLHDEARYLLADCEARRERYTEAAPPLRELLSQAPEHARAQPARLLLGRCEVELGNDGPAARVLEEFLRRDQKDGPVETARGWLWLGRARGELGDAAAAERAYQQVTKLSNGDLAAEAQFRLGASRRARGDADGAIEALLELSVLYGHEPWVPRGLAMAIELYDERSQPEKAARLRQELRTRFPTSAQARALGREGGR